MKTPAIQEMIREIWDLRMERRLNRDTAAEISRNLVLAASADVREWPEYVPAYDGRLTWALEVLDATRGGSSYPKASGDSEALVAFILRLEGEEPERSGRDRAAGEG